MKISVQIVCWSVFSVFTLAAENNAQIQHWQARLEIANTGKAVEFGLEIESQELTDRFSRSKPSVFIVNGKERIRIPVVEFHDDYTHFKFPYYDSEITIEITRDELLGGEASKKAIIRGDYKKLRGDDKSAEMKFTARRVAAIEGENPDSFPGRWKVQFDSSDDPAVGVFERCGHSNRVTGTFLTTTGDYRYLGGYVKNKTLVLCCFDGAHAFRFEAEMMASGKLDGQFWSSNTWHENWTATKNEHAEIPDAFKQSTVIRKSALNELQFPDLQGTKRSLGDIGFQGKARIIYVFGSWCPNCHDAAAYFKELQDKFGPRGLKILGLAFELTSNHRRNAQQIEAYLRRHDVSYPVLIAGPADKAKASNAFPVLDKIRSYPTTIFVDRSGNVRGVHTGFSGPATGEKYKELKQKFEAIIEEMLDD